LNLCKPNTCLNGTNLSVPKRFGLDMFYCSLNSFVNGQCLNIFVYIHFCFPFTLTTFSF
jgi:hypothetical protein